MGFTDRADAAGVDLGRCLITDGEITIGNLPYTSTTVSAGDKKITYTVNQTDTTEKKNELDLVDSGEIFEAEFKEIITQHAVRTNIYDDIYYRVLTSSVSNSEGVVDVKKYKEAVGRIYAATLDPAMISKRKAGFYYTTGEFVYTKEHHGAWGGNSTYTYSVDYTKRYHYKSYFDGSKSQEDIFEITASHSESETIPSTVGVHHSGDFAPGMADDFEQGSFVSVKSAPLSSAMRREVAIVLEQPIIHNKQTDEVWGSCQLYASIDGVPTGPDDPNSLFEYEWDGLVPMDMDKIFEYFGTTFPVDMDSRKTSAGLIVSILASG